MLYRYFIIHSNSARTYEEPGRYHLTPLVQCQTLAWYSLTGWNPRKQIHLPRALLHYFIKNEERDTWNYCKLSGNFTKNRLQSIASTLTIITLILI